MTISTLLPVTKKKRKTPKPQPGDIFVLSVLEHEYMYGMVIKTEVSMMKDEELFYIYDAYSSHKEDIPYSKLTPDNLLIPPQISLVHEYYKWGEFEKVGYLDVTPELTLDQHCFRYHASPTGYVDELDDRIPEPRNTDMCGTVGSATIRSLSYRIALARGIEFVEESEKDTLHNTPPILLPELTDEAQIITIECHEFRDTDTDIMEIEDYIIDNIEDDNISLDGNGIGLTDTSVALYIDIQEDLKKSIKKIITLLNQQNIVTKFDIVVQNSEGNNQFLDINKISE